MYRARAASGRSVAVKIAREPGEAGSWMDQEVRTLARLSAGQTEQPWVVPLLDHGVAQDGRRFLVLPWFDASLAGWLKHNPPIERRLEAMERAITATILLHRSPTDLEAVLLHRDLKPGNLLIREEGDHLEVVLADLGGVKEGRLLAHTQNTGLSTRWYAPLEQQLPLVGALDASVDVHGLAVTMYEALVGRVPQAAMTREGALTADGRHLIALACQGDVRTSKEEADYQELRRAALSRLVAFEEAPPLTADDRVRLREATADLLRGRVGDPEGLAARLSETLLPVLEHALQADPSRRLGNAQHLLAACRQARRLLLEALPRPIVEDHGADPPAPKPTLSRSPGGPAWIWLMVGVLPALGLTGGLVWWWAGRGAAAPQEARSETTGSPPGPEAPQSPVVNVVRRNPETTPAPAATGARPTAQVGSRLSAASPPSPEVEVPESASAAIGSSAEPSPETVTTSPAALARPQQLQVKVNHLSHLSPRIRLLSGGSTLLDATGPSTIHLEAGTPYTLEVSTDGAPACSAELLATPGEGATWTLRMYAVDTAVSDHPMLRCGENGRYILKD